MNYRWSKARRSLLFVNFRYVHV